MNRGPRDMPSLPTLADHLGIHDQWPHCYRCKMEVPASSWTRAGRYLDRAHVIDRWAGGSDGSCNLRPLCHWCHVIQPIFKPGDEAEAKAWFDNPRTAIQDLIPLLNKQISEADEHLKSYLQPILSLMLSGSAEAVSAADRAKREKCDAR